MGGCNRARGVVRLEGPKGPEEGSKVAQNTLKSTDSFRILKCAGMAVVGPFAGAVMQWSRFGVSASAVGHERCLCRHAAKRLVFVLAIRRRCTRESATRHQSSRPERGETMRGCSSSRRSRTSCCDSQRRFSARPNVGGELTAQARRLGREAENTQSRRTAKVPCRSGSARLTG